MLVGFNFNLTYGLKPQVSGIKIAIVYRRAIFQVEWLIATLIIHRRLGSDSRKLESFNFLSITSERFFIYLSSVLVGSYD